MLQHRAVFWARRRLYRICEITLRRGLSRATKVPATEEPMACPSSSLQRRMGNPIWNISLLSQPCCLLYIVHPQKCTVTGSGSGLFKDSGQRHRSLPWAWMKLIQSQCELDSAVHWVYHIPLSGDYTAAVSSVTWCSLIEKTLGLWKAYVRRRQTAWAPSEVHNTPQVGSARTVLPGEGRPWARRLFAGEACCGGRVMKRCWAKPNAGLRVNPGFREPWSES